MNVDSVPTYDQKFAAVQKLLDFGVVSHEGREELTMLQSSAEPFRLAQRDLEFRFCRYPPSPLLSLSTFTNTHIHFNSWMCSSASRMQTYTLPSSFVHSCNDQNVSVRVSVVCALVYVVYVCMWCVCVCGVCARIVCVYVVCVFMCACGWGFSCTGEACMSWT